MEWGSNNQQTHEPNHENQIGVHGNVGLISNTLGEGGGGLMYVKVMTDEQLETLRKQIAVYATICEQLVEMHKAHNSQQDRAGGRLGNLYCDPLASSGQKITARQRWTPSPVQLQILECIFEKGQGTPTKQKIKEIASDLTRHGPISETNVYNWFQNRRARSKRKQQVASSNNADSEVETEFDSQNVQKTRPETYQSQQNPSLRAEDLCFHSQEISSKPHFFGNEQSSGMMGRAGNYNLYEQTERTTTCETPY